MGLKGMKEKEALLFVNKKKQKNFYSLGRRPWALAVQTARSSEQKFFGSFFQKRTAFSKC
jgi:hypothetical protein